MGKYLNKTGLSYLWQKMRNAFAPISHTHLSDDITDLEAISSGELESALEGLSQGEERELDEVCVTGVKGNAESSYRKGEVNITKANIGLGNVLDKEQVTLDTTQTISGSKTFSSQVSFNQKDSYIHSKTITASGWYRIYEFSTYGRFVKLHIGKGYNTVIPEGASIEVFHGYARANNPSASIVQLSGYAGSYFTKVRYTGTGGTAYVDVYINTGGKNNESCYVQYVEGTGVVHEFDSNPTEGQATKELTLTQI